MPLPFGPGGSLSLTDAATRSAMGFDNAQTPHLRQFKRLLDEAMPGLVDLVVLFGPKAIGSDRAGVSWDLAVLLTEDADPLMVSTAASKAARQASDGPHHLLPVVLTPSRLVQGGDLVTHLARYGIPIPD